MGSGARDFENQELPPQRAKKGLAGDSACPLMLENAAGLVKRGVPRFDGRGTPEAFQRFGTAAGKLLNGKMAYDEAVTVSEEAEAKWP